MATLNHGNANLYTEGYQFSGTDSTTPEMIKNEKSVVCFYLFIVRVSIKLSLDLTPIELRFKNGCVLTKL